MLWRIREPNIAELGVIIEPIAQKYRITGVSLFGSRARGDNDRDSDYDLYIQCPSNLSILKILGFISEVEKVLGHHVDVACADSIDPKFYERIKPDLRKVYGAEA